MFKAPHNVSGRFLEDQSIKRIRRIAATTTGVLLAIAAPAFAEGSWSSSVSGALIGFDTRQWTDNSSDNLDTIEKTRGCTFKYRAGDQSVSHTWEYLRNDTWTPDERYGERQFPCKTDGVTYARSWADKGKGEFYFELTRLNGNTSFSDALNLNFIQAQY
jgi:hypothetical protein